MPLTKKKYIPKAERLYPQILHAFLVNIHLIPVNKREKLLDVIIDLAMPDYVQEEWEQLQKDVSTYPTQSSQSSSSSQSSQKDK